jgi:hypothetical protein
VTGRLVVPIVPVVRDADDRATGRDETTAERHDRQLGELLQELRVVLPGVQVLFAFLLTVPFSNRFAETTDTQRDVYFATLMFTTAATVLLMAAPALHRILFRRGVKGEIVEIGHRLTLAGLAMLALAMAGAVVLITDVLFGSTGATIAAGAATLVVTAVLWALLPLLLRRRRARR